ncbi:MAG: hypothetical protein WB803_03210, partial [Pseudolabrys sp.]
MLTASSRKRIECNNVPVAIAAGRSYHRVALFLARRSIKCRLLKAFPGSTMLNIMLILTWIVAFG